MTVCQSVAELRSALDHLNGSVGFVPTMGALHAGHARLLQVAREENDHIVCSIFVNPLQFDRADDLATYPRTLDGDLALCLETGTDIVFTPAVIDLYPQQQLTFVEVPSLEKNLCGAHRPGHFRGVCTVVLKLLNIVRPHRAYFGEKDAQQLTIIRRMVADLAVPVEIVPVPTIREPDGLAMSSRNRLLNPEQRAIAPDLFQALRSALSDIAGGERDTATLYEKALGRLRRFDSVEYFDFVHPDTLQRLTRIEGSALIAAAAWLGSTRLIDNVIWNTPS